MSANAARPGHRATRTGTHLTLITGGMPGPQDDSKQAAEPTAPVRRMPPAGSATVRALIALGALLSALGMSVGKAEAVLGGHAVRDRPVEADPDIPALPEVATAPVPVAPAAPAAPAVPVAANTGHTVTAATARTVPGHWAPAVKPVEAHVYKLSTPVPGTGRHRKTGTDETADTHVSTKPTGRHRKPEQHADNGHTHPGQHGHGGERHEGSRGHHDHHHDHAGHGLTLHLTV
jgi:hypothetical protein